MTALDAWAEHRGQQRPNPHPRTGQPTDFLFTEHGKRLKPWRIRTGLRTGPEHQPSRGQIDQQLQLGEQSGQVAGP